MKRFLNYYLSLSLIASLFVVSSCGEEEDPIVDGPAITLGGVTGDEMIVDVGEEVDFDVNVTAPGGFNRLAVYYTVGEGGTRQTLVDTARAAGSTAPTTFSFPFSLPIPASVAGEDLFFEFLAVDDVAQEATRDFIIRVNEMPVNEVVTYNTVLLQAPTQSQTNKVWFSTSTGERYSTQEVNNSDQPISAQIDFGYRYGLNAKATLASPANYPTEGAQNITDWTAKNETMLKRVQSGVSETAFVEMGNTSAALVTAFENGTAGTNPERITDLRVGDVLAFVTDPDKPGELGGRYGLIYVDAINLGADGTGFGADASISLNVKVQSGE